MFALNENQPANHRNHCIKVSPLKPTAKLENLDYIREILQFPFTVELNLGADGFQRYAVFDFESHEVAAEALKIIRVHLGCRRYNSPVYDFNSQAYFHNPRPFIPINDSRPRAVYVGNLGPTTTLEDLQNFAANTFDSGFVGVWMGNRLISDVNLRTTCYGTFLFETADDTHGAFHRLLRLKLTNQLDPEILPKCQIEFSRKFREYGYQQLPAAELREANYRQQPIFLLV